MITLSGMVHAAGFLVPTTSRHSPYVDGARGDDATDNAPAFNLPVPDGFRGVALGAGTYRIASDATLVDATFDPGAVVRPEAGARITLVRPSAGLWQIVDLSLGGTATVGGAVHPEWFGALGDGVTDDNDAWRWLAQSITHGTTIRTSEGAVYVIGNAVLMDPAENRAIKIDGINDLTLTGGGTIKRAPTEGVPSVVLWIGNGTHVRVEAKLDGSRNDVPASSPVLDTLVISQCEHVALPLIESRDSLRHGVNVDRCRYVSWGQIDATSPTRYGASCDALRYVNVGSLIAVRTSTRTAMELTNGCSDVIAGNILAVACSDGVLMGEHEAPDQTNQRIVYPVILVNGTDPDAVVTPGSHPATEQIVSDRGLVIHGGSHTDPVTGVVTSNDNNDITIGILEVHYVLSIGLKANQVYRLSVGQARLVNNGVPNRRGAYVTDSGEVMMANGWVRDWGVMMEFVRCERVILRNLVFEGNRGALTFRDCPWVTLENCTFRNNTGTDYLVHVLNTEGFAMARLDVVNCTGVGNGAAAVRLAAGSTGTLGELRWRDNPGLGFAPYPASYEPVAAYFTDDTSTRTLAVNSAAPRVDRSTSWSCQNTAATSISTFGGGRDGMRITVFFDDANTTLLHDAASGIDLQGGTDWTPTPGSRAEFIRRGARWTELARVTA